jgi:hypothetical protein
MTDRTSGNADVRRDAPDEGHEAANQTHEPQRLDEAECLRLISPGGIGRLGYSGRFGPMVIPVNYSLYEGTVVFRTAHDSPTDQDLRTGMEGAEFRVAFEIDEIDTDAHAGWSVLIQGGAHHVESEAELASVRQVGLVPWAGGERELFIRIAPARITGRRVGNG